MLNARFIESSLNIDRLSKELAVRYKGGTNLWINTSKDASWTEFIHYLENGHDYLYLHVSIKKNDELALDDYEMIFKTFISETKYADLSRVRLFMKDDSSRISASLIIYTYNSVFLKTLNLNVEEKEYYLSLITNIYLEHLHNYDLAKEKLKNKKTA